MIWPRFVIALFLLASPVWAGADGRSLWTLPLLIGVFTIAYIDGKNRIWRSRFAQLGVVQMLGSIAGAMVAQTILVSLLFFTAAGVATLWGEIGERAPLDRLDFAVSGAVLAICLLGGAATRWAEGGRDPVDRALEEFGEAIKGLDDLDPDHDEDDVDAALGENDDYRPAYRGPGPTTPRAPMTPLAQLREEAETFASRAVVSDREIDGVAKRIVAHFGAGSEGEAFDLLCALASPTSGASDSVEASHRRLVGCRGLVTLARERPETLWSALSRVETAALEAIGPDSAPALRLVGVELIATLGLGGDHVLNALRALEAEMERASAAGGPELTALKARAEAEIARLERL